VFADIVDPVILGLFDLVFEAGFDLDRNEPWQVPRSGGFTGR